MELPISHTIIYEAIEAPTVDVISVTPDVFQLPIASNVIIDTVWTAVMQEDSSISGMVKILGTMHSGVIAATDSDTFMVQILKATPLSSGIHSLEYEFLVSHSIFGEVEVTGIAVNKLFIAHPPVQEGYSSINAFSVFPDIVDVSSGSYPLTAEINIHSYLYGNATIHLNTPDALIVDYITAGIGDIELDVDGRFSGSEIPITITASGMTYIENTHVMRVELHRSGLVFHSYDSSLEAGDTDFTHTIQASAFVDAFDSLGYGTYFIRLQILQNETIVGEREVEYRIVPHPNIVLTDISHSIIQLPLFAPINLIAAFTVSDNISIDSISGSLMLNEFTGTNTSSDQEGKISIALMNIATLSQGTHSLNATFEINSRYGCATITQSFSNIITVFPHIQTDGVDIRYEYDLILCMPNRTELAFIEAYDVIFNPMFLQYNQLKFSIYREIVTEDNTVYINPVWEKILSDALVLMNIRINDLVVYTEYFVIENPAISYSGLDELSFQANSWEILFLNNLDLSGWHDAVKRLYDPTNRIGDDGLPHGIMNYILTMKWNNVWTLRHVDSTVLERERVLSFTGNNMRFVIDTLEESFHCVFVFDNVNMTLDIFEREVGMLGNNRGLVVADDTYATSISYREDTTGIKTRIFVFGKNNATIARYNPTGQLYIDDFSFYMTTQYMTQELIDALAAYKDLVRSKYGVWESLVDEMDDFLDNSPPDSLIPIELLEQMREIIDLLAWENNFTLEQIKQIAPFIKEDTVNVNTIENGRELYRFALRHIKTTAFVPIQISIECIDVLALEEHQREWLKFRVGDFANIYREELGLAYKEMRLISYEHNPIQNSLRLEFSNRDELVTMQWLNNMFFYRLGNMENTWNNERDWYIRIPEFDFNAPELRDLIQNVVQIEVDNSLEIVIKEIDERVFNQIEAVFETTVLAAETAHILNAWIRFLKVDMLETNFEALDPRISWPQGAEPFVRYFIRISDITMQHIRAELSPTEIENYITPGFRANDGTWVGGDQIYWTAIGDNPQAFRFFTITDPISVFSNGTLTLHNGNTITLTNRRILTNPLPPDIEAPPDYVEVWRDMTPAEMEDVRETFRVKVRKTIRESVRKTDAFEYINNPSGSGRTMIPKTVWGGGTHVDPNLTNGRGYQYKDWDNFYMTYTTRTGAGTTPVGTEIGIRLRDDGCWYFDMEENDWKLIGSGKDLDIEELKEIVKEIVVDINVGGEHIIMPRLPTQAEIDLMPVNAVVLVYNPLAPFIPES